jgi:hypothetical protein
VITTWAPAAARAVAVAFPTPELAPVTTTVIPDIGDTSAAEGWVMARAYAEQAEPPG